MPRLSSYADRHYEQLDAFHLGLGRQPELIASLPADLSITVLRYLLSLACESQNDVHIGLGRGTFAAMPSDWLATCIHPVAESRLDLTDDWECRRLIELYSLIDSPLAMTFAESCAASTNPEIVDAGRDYIDDPNGMAATARKSLGQSRP